MLILREEARGGEPAISSHNMYFRDHWVSYALYAQLKTTYPADKCEGGAKVSETWLPELISTHMPAWWRNHAIVFRSPLVSQSPTVSWEHGQYCHLQQALKRIKCSTFIRCFKVHDHRGGEWVTGRDTCRGRKARTRVNSGLCLWFGGKGADTTHLWRTDAVWQ